MKKLGIMLCVLSFLSFWAFPADTSFAYEITEEELTELEENLNMQRKENEISKKESKKLELQLTESQKESQTLKTELAVLKNQTSEQEKRLIAAQKSLDAYAKEEKKEKDRLRLQRGLAYGIAVVAVVAFVRK